MTQFGLSLITQPSDYSQDELYKMFGATARIVAPRERTAQQQNLAAELEATKPGADQIVQLIAASWDLNIRENDDVAHMKSIYQKVGVFTQIYPDLLDDAGLRNCLLHNCFDRPSISSNHFIAGNYQANATVRSYNLHMTGRYDKVLNSIWAGTPAVDVDTLLPLKEAKYNLYHQAIQHQNWKMDKSTFSTLMKTACVYRQDYDPQNTAFQIYRPALDVLAVAMAVNKINPHVLYDDQEQHKINCLRPYIIQIQEKALDYHAGLKVQEAKSFYHSIETPALQVKDTKAEDVQAAPMGAGSQETIIPRNEPIPSARIRAAKPVPRVIPQADNASSIVAATDTVLPSATETANEADDIKPKPKKPRDLDKALAQYKRFDESVAVLKDNHSDAMAYKRASQFAASLAIPDDSDGMIAPAQVDIDLRKASPLSFAAQQQAGQVFQAYEEPLSALTGTMIPVETIEWSDRKIKALFRKFGDPRDVTLAMGDSASDDVEIATTNAANWRPRQRQYHF